MQLTPYLAFNGDCETAFRFYAQHLGGKIAFMMRYGESPMADQFPDSRDRIMHISLQFPGGSLQGADAPPQHYRKPQGFCVSLSLNDIAEAERIFSAMSEGGTVQMPLQETFWAARFGMFLDSFGVPWMINCEKGV